MEQKSQCFGEYESATSLFVQDHLLWNIVLNKKAISTQWPFMNPMIPPAPHWLCGHKLFNLIAKLNSHQSQATPKCCFFNCLNGKGYHNVLELSASTTCWWPNFLQPIAKLDSHLPQTTSKCNSLNHLDRERVWQPSWTVIYPKQPLNVTALITLTEKGYDNVQEQHATIKCPHPNLLQSLAELHSQLCVMIECIIFDIVDFF